MRPAARALAAALMTIAAAPGPAAAAGAPELAVDAPAFTLSRRQVGFTVAQSGALAGRRLTVVVFLDGDLLGTRPTAGARTRLEIGDLDLPPGIHELTVKSGSYEARDRFRVVESSVAVGGGAGVVVVAAALAVFLSRRRRSRRT